MAKKKITDLLSDELTESVSSKQRGMSTNEALSLKAPGEGQQLGKPSGQQPLVKGQNASKVTDSVSSHLPKYLTLERKEVRLPSEHLDELTRLARQLNRARQGAGERITENTLIRVAITTLIDHADQLEGTTEQELLESWRGLIS